MTEMKRMDAQNEAEHCLQYAVVGGIHTVMHTDGRSDQEITHFLGHSGAIDRFDRCPLCEEWTYFNGKLRSGMGCPAVQGEVQRIAEQVEMEADRDALEAAKASSSDWVADYTTSFLVRTKNRELQLMHIICDYVERHPDHESDMWLRVAEWFVGWASSQRTKELGRALDALNE